MENNRLEILIKLIKELHDKIYVTRKSYINAEQRLIKKNSFFQFITVYYSIVLIFASILNIRLSDSAITSLFLLSSSVAMSLFSLYIISKNITERHFSFKFNYIKLHELLDELDALMYESLSADYPSNNLQRALNNIKTRYLNVLSSVENHKTVDYLQFLKDKGEELSKHQQKLIQRNYWKGKVKELFFIAFPFLAYYILEVLIS
ncbi:SLATT domain-containing protein [Rossellomorea marisflavi]|uniref:SLATT domain-containing protein n=1 Tax=Rossellomorea marisflavi TaxID=189381 RepID=UPI003D2E6835